MARPLHKLGVLSPDTQDVSLASTQLMSPWCCLALNSSLAGAGQKGAVDREVVDRSKNTYVLTVVLFYGKQPCFTHSDRETRRNMAKMGP